MSESEDIEVKLKAIAEGLSLLEIEVKLKANAAELEHLFAQIAPLQERVRAIRGEDAELQRRRDTLVLEASPEPDWAKLVKELPNGSGVMHRYARTKLAERFDMWLGGYWSDTLEQDFELKVERNDESEKKNALGVRTLAPLLTPHADGRVWFKLFEHTLSQYGIYHLEALTDLSKVWVTRTVYGRKTDAEEFDSVEGAVRYVRENHWYGERAGDDSES